MAQLKNEMEHDNYIKIIYVEAALLDNSLKLVGDCKNLLKTIPIETLVDWGCSNFIQLWDVSKESFQYFCDLMVRFLDLCEQIYPPENGQTCIPPEKLEKAYQKGLIPRPTAGDEELDDDMDSKIDKAIKDVWAYYDKKNKGFLSKGEAETFFKDALEVMALRKGLKVKQILPPNVSQSQAISQSIAKLTKGSDRVEFSSFEEYINMSDLDEALSLFTGQTGPIEVKTNVQMVDTSKLAADARAANGPKPVYRDYPDD